MKRKVQPVSFNVEDDYERELLEYALGQQKYFSRYVKRLIEKDREGVPTLSIQTSPTTPVAAPPPTKKAKSLVSAFL